ncbi:hypothetical protein [Streptomyces sp. NBC_00105]|uniref:hypothetical protein n=1 Tax=unclassified Streptomyces TaxID=2593676 RepID=UPI0028877CD6|nr:hypothetical protein [Streptomyces sp. DSM 41633]
MSVLLGELSKKIAERWLSLLVLPGALYLAVAATAHVLGHAHALDLARLTARVTGGAKAPIATTAGGQVVLLAAVLAGAAAVGLAAQGLGSLVERGTLAAGWRAWPSPFRQLADRRVSRRRDRWRAQHAIYHQQFELARAALVNGVHLDPRVRHTAYRARTRIAVELPDRLTWSGDRVHATAVRLDRDYTLDIATVWPYLWLHLPEPVRAEITTARQELARATTLGGWALLYAPLTAWWWPAAALTAVIAVTAWQRTRTATDTHALLVEATARQYAGDLARHLGIEHAGPLTPHLGDALTRLLFTQPPPRPSEEPRRGLG